VCSESGLHDDLSWGRLGYIRWLDTAQDLCHSKTTHPLDHTDFTQALHARLRHVKYRDPSIHVLTAVIWHTPLLPLAPLFKLQSLFGYIHRHLFTVADST